MDGAASETGIPVVISSKYRPNCAALSEVPRAASTISRGRRFWHQLLEALEAFQLAAQRLLERVRLLPDLFQHAGHWLQDTGGAWDHAL